MPRLGEEAVSMKYIIAILLLVAVFAGCQTKTIVGSTITVQWDAPALGTIPPAEMSYEVWLQPYPTGTAVLMATVATLEQPITFSAEGAYKIGVRSKRTVASDSTVLYSTYLWSDVAGTPQPWYAAYYVTPAHVDRVRIK
jgi:hypothetical protein